jgi:hypothetical protein
VSARLRATVWPGETVPLPPVPVWDVRVHEDDWLELVGAPREVDVPPDFYLREMDANRPTITVEVIEFVGRWGRCSDPLGRDLPDALKLDVEAELHRDGRLPKGRRLDDEREKIIAALSVPPGTYLAVTRRVVHVSEVQQRIDRMHEMARYAADGLAGVERDEAHWDLFAELLNPALSAFQVNVDVGAGRSVGLPDVSAYSVAALQILNDVARETPMLRCSNERCPNGGFFTRQRGRAQYGQHRTFGTKYCDSACARAQGERERRRRKAKAVAQ